MNIFINFIKRFLVRGEIKDKIKVSKKVEALLPIILNLFVKL